MLMAQIQTGDKVNTVIGQMIYTLTAVSPVTIMVVNSICKELMYGKVVKKSNTEVSKASVATSVTPVSTVDPTVTTPLTPITTTAVTSAIKGLQSGPLTKQELALPSTCTGASSKTTGEPSG